MKLPSAAGSCLEDKAPLPVLPLGTGLKAAGDQLPSFVRKDCLLKATELSSKTGALLRPLALSNAAYRLPGRCFCLCCHPRLQIVWRGTQMSSICR